MNLNRNFLLDGIVGKGVFLLQNALPDIAFAEYRHWENERIVKSHSHPDLFQLDFFPSGEGTYQIEKNSSTITNNEFYFVPVKHAHEIRSSATHPLIGLTVKFRHPRLDAEFLSPAIKIQPATIQQAEGLFRQVVSESVISTVENKHIASLRLSELLVFLYQAYRETQHAVVKNPVVLNVIRYLATRFDKSLSLAWLAQVADVSEEHLCRIFKKETGVSPIEFLQLLRMEQAKMRLSGEDGNISDIAALTGFGKSADMNRCFRKHLGISSREYRQKTWRETKCKN